MEMWLYVENIGVHKSTLNKDHIRVGSCNKYYYQEHILINR